jgi:hypothetical protein
MAGKSRLGLQKPCVKRVTVLSWFHPNRPMSLLAQQLWGFRLPAFEGGFSAPGMLPRSWHALRYKEHSENETVIKLISRIKDELCTCSSRPFLPTFTHLTRKPERIRK